MLTKAIRTRWNTFPEVVIHAPLGLEKKFPDKYLAAKSGDVDAAFEMVQSSVNIEKIAAIRNLIGDERPIIVAVHAEEIISINEIPFAFAKILSNHLQLPLNTDIVQATKVSRTGADGFHRLANCPRFSGDFPPGQTAIIVDDTLTQGGTFASLKGHIEQQGGKVLLASAMTGKNYSAKLAISQEILIQLRKFYGNLEIWWIETFGYGFDCLTESEARYLIKSGQSVDRIRDRILASRYETGE